MVKLGFVKLDTYPEGIEVDGKVVEPVWKFAHDGDACADIYAARMTILDVNEIKVIPTGVKLEIPEGYVHDLSSATSSKGPTSPGGFGQVSSAIRGIPSTGR